VRGLAETLAVGHMSVARVNLTRKSWSRLGAVAVLLPDRPPPLAAHTGCRSAQKRGHGTLSRYEAAGAWKARPRARQDTHCRRRHQGASRQPLDTLQREGSARQRWLRQMVAITWAVRLRGYSWPGTHHSLDLGRCPTLATNRRTSWPHTAGTWCRTTSCGWHSASPRTSGASS
jgi:hypothetical protein